MHKELIPTLVLIFALFGGAYYFSESVQAPFVSFLNTAKTAYHDTMERADQLIEEHFFQQQTILNQREQLQAYAKDQLLLTQLRSELKACKPLMDANLSFDPRVTLARTLSYAKFGDMRKMWLEMADFNESRVYGLVYDNTAAGIVVASRNQPLALLNGDPKSSYAVFVGTNRAPGIVHGRNSDTLIVKYIPTWIRIAEGDEVVTSGMDNLFFQGLKVGRVLSVSLAQGYQSAVVQPYYNADVPDYFHVITRVH
jgi:rod shape-determining protein MreC